MTPSFPLLLRSCFHSALTLRFSLRTIPVSPGQPSIDLPPHSPVVRKVSQGPLISTLVKSEPPPFMHPIYAIDSFFMMDHFQNYSLRSVKRPDPPGFPSLFLRFSPSFDLLSFPFWKDGEQTSSLFSSLWSFGRPFSFSQASIFGPFKFQI